MSQSIFPLWPFYGNLKLIYLNVREFCTKTTQTHSCTVLCQPRTSGRKWRSSRQIFVQNAAFSSHTNSTISLKYRQLWRRRQVRQWSWDIWLIVVLLVSFGASNGQHAVLLLVCMPHRWFRTCGYVGVHCQKSRVHNPCRPLSDKAVTS
jgi:hypothetical protein